MSEPQLTARQAAIITAHTGISCERRGMAAFHAYAEKLLGRPIWTHEFADPEMWAKIKEASKDDFIALCADGEES